MKRLDKAELFRVLIPVGIAVLGGLLVLGGMWLSENLRLRDADPEEREIVLPAAAPAEGVGRVPEAARYLGAAEAECPHTVWIACEFDDPLPWWWDPEGAIPVEEYHHSAEVGKKGSDVVRKDGGCPDWDLNTSLVGWDGRTMEVWEMDLFARIMYLEFWGTSPECCEAGADSMLNLWASGLYGETLGECLSGRNDAGAWIYSPYPNVWTTKYDPDGLREMRELCEERFRNGPEWGCVYFQLYGYHDPSWTVPLYEIDGVFFSAGR